MISKSGERSPLRRRLSILAIAIGGIVASGALFAILHKRERALVEAQFNLAAEERLAAIDREFQRDLDAVVDLAAFYAASQFVDRDEFRLFTTRVLSSHTSISALQWVPRIEHAEREDFERELAEVLAAQRSIIQIGTDDMMVEAETRAEYFPVDYAEPAGENQAAFGFDHGSDPPRFKAMEQARDLGRPVASRPLSLLRTSIGVRDRTGILVFLPIYRNGAPTETVGDRRRNLTGFCTGVLALDTMIDSALEYSAAGEVDVVVTDTGATGSDVTYVHSSDPIGDRLADFESDGGLHRDHDLTLAERRYRVRCVPTTALLEGYRSWIPAGAGLAALSITVLLVVYLLQLASEAIRTQRQVDERTADLRTSNERLAVEARERARSEEALRESEERFELAVKGSSDGLWDWNVSTGSLYYAPRFKEMLGYVGEEFPDVFESFESHLHPEDHDRVLDLIQAHVDQRVPYDIEYRLRTSAGPYRWFRARGQAVWAPDGTAVRMAGSVTDVTEQRAMAGELSLAMESLRLQNAELHTLQDSLQAAVSDLERSNQELDDFAYIASHDLKEPLRGLHNYASFLLEDYADRLDEEGQSKLRTLTKLTQRMETLIDSLLHFSRVGRTDMAVGDVDLGTIVSEITETLEFSLQEKNIEIRMPRPLPAAEVDRVRVGELFRNLITNATKYNDKPDPWIEIGWIEPDDGASGGDAVQSGVTVYYVRDNGIGIPEKHRAAVFRLFKRLHGRDKYGGGTGAGLTIVKKIVECHGGRIWLDSTPGEGTTFYFTLAKEHANVDIHAGRAEAHTPG